MPAGPAPAVTVWRVPLAQPDAVLARAAACLAPDELERAARFYFERDRRRYVLARSALRQVLAGQLGLAPAAVRFVYSAAGKPGLAPEHAGPPLSFNLSHSHDRALIALARGQAVGVDVEYHRPLTDLADLARRFFAPREAARLLALPADEQPPAFFRCWTRKEAYIKAIGDGLAAGLDTFEVAFGPGESPALLSVAGDPGEAAQWSVVDVSPASNYAGAVAVRARGANLEVRQWSFS